MLTIRLSRVGKTKQPNYRVIISEKGRDPFGQSLEILGFYNPFSKVLDIKKERVEYWLSKGAHMSPTVNNLLIDKKIIEGKKVIASKRGKKEKVAEKVMPAKGQDKSEKKEDIKTEEEK